MSKKKAQKKISLHPLKLSDALKELLKIKPQPNKNSKDKDKKSDTK